MGLHAAVIKTSKDQDNFMVHIEYPYTDKCENIPLTSMLHVFVLSEILNGFEGKLPNGVWYSLVSKSGHPVWNWKFAMKDIFGELLTPQPIAISNSIDFEA
jgi:hypothetical protein